MENKDKITLEGKEDDMEEKCPRCKKTKCLYYVFYFFEEGRPVTLCTSCQHEYFKKHDESAKKFLEVNVKTCVRCEAVIENNQELNYCEGCLKIMTEKAHALVRKS